jgi:hypothetical protein
VLNSTDGIAINNDAYTFQNGKKQGAYESNTLKALDLPGVNDRNEMPKKETRSKAERESDTGAIEKYCDLPRSQT